MWERRARSSVAGSGSRSMRVFIIRKGNVGWVVRRRVGEGVRGITYAGEDEPAKVGEGVGADGVETEFRVSCFEIVQC